MTERQSDFCRELEECGKILSLHNFEVRELPWRTNPTPYRVFLSEFLLVRTRTDVVAKYFEQISSAYPTIYHLAHANRDELEIVLAPLGLRKRVELLIRGAKYVVDEFEGEIPSNIARLVQVPGLGTYTATAIVVFLHNADEVPADVNILRFLSRLTGLPMINRTKGSSNLRSLVGCLSTSTTRLPVANLLDFARLVCRSRLPRCMMCPLTQHCAYFREFERKSGSRG